MDCLSYHGGMHLFAYLGSLRIYAGKPVAPGATFQLAKFGGVPALVDRSGAKKIAKLQTASLRSSNPEGLIVLIDDRGQVWSN